MNDAAKRIAGEAAARLVENGMRVGLGSGSTMRHAVAALAARVAREGLKILGFPTSSETEAQARAAGIPLAEPDATPIDLALDGSDEIELGTLRLVKGHGGALLREKIVAQASRRFVIVADATKLVRQLGTKMALPVEISRFGHAATLHRIADLGGAPTLRLAAGQPFVTDGGNVIADCAGFAPIRDPYTLERSLRSIAGVLGTGLFLMPIELALIGQDDGSVQELRS
jgi:ribose 5-phosphate isomerase A